jgi:hypothetical protein
MAMVEGFLRAKYEFLDIENKKAYVEAILPNPFPPPADAITYFDALGDAMVALTDCNLVGYVLSFEHVEDALVQTPGVEVENSLRLTIGSAGSDNNILTIPGIAPSATFWTAGNRDIANQADPDVVALINSLIDGDGTVVPTDERGDDLEADGTTGAYRIINAVKYHRRSHVAGGGRRG